MTFTTQQRYTMATILEKLPLDMVNYIKSFLYIVSWRADLHYFKLYRYGHTRRFATLPRQERSTITEYPNRYTFINVLGSESCVYKWNVQGVEEMKHVYVNRYTTPLWKYLFKFRIHHSEQSWSPTTSFQLCGYDINGKMSPYTYRRLLSRQAMEEGFMKDTDLWQGCIPLQEYRTSCIYSCMPTKTFM